MNNFSFEQPKEGGVGIENLPEFHLQGKLYPFRKDISRNLAEIRLGRPVDYNGLINATEDDYVMEFGDGDLIAIWPPSKMKGIYRDYILFDTKTLKAMDKEGRSIGVGHYGETDDLGQLTGGLTVQDIGRAFDLKKEGKISFDLK